MTEFFEMLREGASLDALRESGNLAAFVVCCVGLAVGAAMVVAGLIGRAGARPSNGADD